MTTGIPKPTTEPTTMPFSPVRPSHPTLSRSFPTSLPGKPAVGPHDQPSNHRWGDLAVRRRQHGGLDRPDQQPCHAVLVRFLGRPPVGSLRQCRVRLSSLQLEVELQEAKGRCHRADVPSPGRSLQGSRHEVCRHPGYPVSLSASSEDLYRNTVITPRYTLSLLNPACPSENPLEFGADVPAPTPVPICAPHSL
eukprot:767175-Hanusia_phi.AAC.13